MDYLAISKFLPLDTTATAMLGVFVFFLGLRFVRIPDEEIGPHAIWHDTVQAFSVWDETDGDDDDDASFIGHLYFDLLWRENKFRGGQNVTMECVSGLWISSFFRP